MNQPCPKIAFLAVLIYDHGNGRYCEEPRVYHATHPEIAYQLALADGSEQRYGRRFLGLSHLEATTGEVEPIACSRKGDASGFVVGRDALAVFSDPRWRSAPCNEAELATALQEPPQLFEVDGVDKVRWHEYTHAYGNASELPRDLRRLASSEPQVRKQALWELSGSIYHQGTIYPATAVALPFLLRLASDSRVPDRAEIWQLLKAIAESSVTDPERIREAWAWRRKLFGESFGAPSEEMAAHEVAARAAVHATFLETIATIRQCESDVEVGKLVMSILAHLDRGRRAT